MAVTKGAVADALAGFLVTDTIADSTAETNVTGNSSGVVHFVYVNATSQTTPVYAKTSYNGSASSGSTVPENKYYAPAGKAMTYISTSGHAYSGGALSFWGTTTSADGSTQADPGANLTVRILAT
jgi:hypothetical protein